MEIGDAELEQIAARGWPGTEAESLGDWVLRSGGGWTGRANSVFPLGDPGIPVPDALAQVRAWYADRGLPARFQIAMPLAAELDAALEAGGWTAADHSGVWVADIAGLSLGVDAKRLGTVPVLQVDEVPDDGWLATYHYRGGRLPDTALPVLLAGDRPQFVSLRERTKVLAVARLSRTGDWVGVTAVEVADHARRRGLASVLVQQALGASGARYCYLQVSDSNEAGLALYRRLGFRRHHRYHYRTWSPGS
jgi:ribosomal protein S18 acetylase RimI-like enzyme